MVTEVLVNIGSGIDLLPDGNKPLHEPMRLISEMYTIIGNYIDTVLVSKDHKLACVYTVDPWVLNLVFSRELISVTLWNNVL